MTMRFAMTLGLVVVAGCNRPQPPTEPTSLLVSVHTEADMAALWDASEAVLRDHLFRIDRRDRSGRTMNTYPETSQQPMEFWRRDVATAYDFAEAALRTVRRTAEVQFSEEPPPTKLTITVKVVKERFHTIERQTNDPAAGLQAFSTRIPTTTGRSFDETDAYWTAEGRDGAMENRLGERIVAAYHKLTAAE